MNVLNMNVSKSSLGRLMRIGVSAVMDMAYLSRASSAYVNPMFKPKLCCILNPEVVCHCTWSVCMGHMDYIQDHFYPRPNTPYYYHCVGDPLLVVWQDLDSKPVRYRLAFYEGPENQKNQGPYKEELGDVKSLNKDNKRQNKVSKVKTKERVGKNPRLLRQGLK